MSTSGAHEGVGPRNRRIDRVLGDGFLDRLSDVDIAEVRARRDDAAQEEADLSYLRRLLQGRIDIISAQLRRRSGTGEEPLVESLPHILAESSGTARGLGRHLTVEPSRADAHRRHVEALVADVDLSDVDARTDEELRRSLSVFEAEEHEVSDTRRAVQAVVDACAAELARRYRDGEASVGDLLTGNTGDPR